VRLGLRQSTVSQYVRKFEDQARRHLFLLKNVFGVGIGRQMILAEACSWVGLHHRYERRAA
jgi:hypothetical protein